MCAGTRGPGQAATEQRSVANSVADSVASVNRSRRTDPAADRLPRLRVMDQWRLPDGRRPQLVATMRASARWRKQKADEFADVPLARRRSHRAMVAIFYAARFVENLPDDDRDLSWL
jgi:hypothetical protein